VEWIHEFLEPQLSWRFPAGSRLCSAWVGLFIAIALVGLVITIIGIASAR
jgi:hypothetical protein